MNTFSTDKGVTIRQPSTANLMIDSADRNTTLNPSCFDFQITRPQSIMNGFFTRCGTTEVVLEWCEPNVIDDAIIFDISGASVRSTQTLSIFTTFLNVAQLLNEIAVAFTGYNGVTFSVSQIGNSVGIDASGGRFRILTSPLAVRAELDLSSSLSTRKTIGQCPDLRLYRYLDFVSPQLTYSQDLKDTSTQTISRDVLCRWYMAEDSQETYDQYGFPILMGYEPFVRRRLYNPPKQIKWDNNLPMGNLQFQVYGDDGNILDNYADTQWLMTLQLTEN